MRMKERECAFCKGTGSDPFNLLSKLAACQVCGGAGIVQVEEPAIGCIFCRGTGVYPHNGRVTCTVCKGKGMVTVKGSTRECRTCRGTGTAAHSGLPCVECGGKGVVSKK